MKIVILILVIAAAVWAYFNIDFSNLSNAGQDAQQTVKQEKTLNKFFSADEQNKNETNKTIQENF